MSALVAYLAPAIGFFAAIVGLLGPSRNPSRTGVAAITVFGWSSAALAAVSLCVGLVSIHTKEMELVAARAAQQRIRSVAYSELREGLRHMTNVLRYAALIPYTTVPQLSATVPRGTPVPRKSFDLRSPETVRVLENVYLSPTLRLRAPFVPSAVPFGTDVVRSSMNVLVEESKAAATEIDKTIQKYAATGISPDVIEGASAILRSPFLKHLTTLRESWGRRAQMECTESPVVMKFTFLNSGITGGQTKDYLQFVDEMQRLEMLLATTS